MKFTHIVFQNERYWLIGTEDGAIATERQFRAGNTAFAHLTPSGDILQRGTVIGTRDDIQFGETFEPPPYLMPPNAN